MKTNKIIHRIATTLMCLLFFGSAMMYVFVYPRAEAFFVSLGYPTYLIYPLAALKVLGVLTVATRFSSFLKELAYAGFLYDAILALAGHLMVADGEYPPAVVAIVLTVTSWVFDRKVYGPYRQTASAELEPRETAD